MAYDKMNMYKRKKLNVGSVYLEESIQKKNHLHLTDVS